MSRMHIEVIAGGRIEDREGNEQWENGKTREHIEVIAGGRIEFNLPR